MGTNYYVTKPPKKLFHYAWNKYLTEELGIEDPQKMAVVRDMLIELAPKCEAGMPPTYRPLHIGKSSAGWVFSLCWKPELSLESWEEWKAMLSLEGVEIKDEYGLEVSLDELEKIVTQRSHPTDFGKDPAPKPYATWRDFFWANSCRPGPNGLVRNADPRGFRAKDGFKAGEGTWDLIKGEFS